MNAEEFKTAAGEMADYITGYHENIRSRRALADVKPGFLRPLIPETAPETPEKWEDIMKDLERVIMPGVTHWDSPRFHAYFPTANSYPALLADMLSDAIGCIGFSWISSPSCTELEVVMLDWLGELCGLPENFLARSECGTGGGVIQGTASEATLVALLSAKNKILQTLPQDTNSNNLIAYASDQAHSSVERAAMLGGVKIRLLSTDEHCSLRGPELERSVQEDIAKGLHPFCVVATLGTTSLCSYDNLKELGEVANRYKLWMHVDAAYAGSSFVCEEFRGPLLGVELADSYNFNPHKWLLVNFDCSAMWVKTSSDLVDAFNVDPLYLKHEHQSEAPDYRHWHIPLGRRFRSLKLWFVMRLYGKVGLQNHIRGQVCLAKEFEKFVRGDERFEVTFPVTLGLVCFRLKGKNEINETLLKKINNNGKIYLVPSKVKEKYFLRFAICSSSTNSDDVQFSWMEIQANATKLLDEISQPKA